MKERGINLFHSNLNIFHDYRDWFLDEKEKFNWQVMFEATSKVIKVERASYKHKNSYTVTLEVYPGLNYLLDKYQIPPKVGDLVTITEKRKKHIFAMQNGDGDIHTFLEKTELHYKGEEINAPKFYFKLLSNLFNS